ncbi:MAG TPA: hypothetical protein EYQ02_13650 [Microbacterium sp.]|nr:hypothetical protein [Microbacterium sp.]
MTVQDLGPVGTATRSRKTIEIVIGVLLFASAWEIIGRTGVLSTSWPPLTDVLWVIVDPARAPRLWGALGVTVQEGLLGGVIGISAAVATAVLSRLMPVTRRPAERFAVLVEAVPVVALGPLLMVLLPRAVVPAALAATAAYFAAFVVICSALWTRRAAQEDLFAVLGARRIAVLAQRERQRERGDGGGTTRSIAHMNDFATIGDLATWRQGD